MTEFLLKFPHIHLIIEDIQQKREQENSNNTECEFPRSGIFHPQYSNENCIFLENSDSE